MNGIERMLVGLSLALALNQAALAEPVGEVRELQGSAVVIRAGQTTSAPLAIKAPIHQLDIIKTGATAQVRVRFLDDTVVTLGESSTLEVTEYVYSPQTAQRRSILTIPEGFFRALVNKYLKGTVFEVRTMSAVAAVRSTEWMGQISPQRSSMVVLEGTVAITSTDPDIAGEVLLSPGRGIDVLDGEPLPEERIWGQGRVNTMKIMTSLHGE